MSQFPFNGLEAAKLMGEEGKVMINSQGEIWRVDQTTDNFEQLIDGKWLEKRFQMKHIVRYWRQAEPSEL
jgi:hypothetical protein